MRLKTLVQSRNADTWVDRKVNYAVKRQILQNRQILLYNKIIYNMPTYSSAYLKELVLELRLTKEDNFRELKSVLNKEYLDEEY
jgi:hypothetical protein